MTGREHVQIGAGSTILAAGAWQQAHGGVNVGVLAALTAAAVLGSLSPDLDHPFSLLSMSIPAALIGYGGGFLAAVAYARAHQPAFDFGLSRLGPEWTSWAWAAVTLGFALLILSFALGGFFGHRGPVHSLAFGAGATVIMLGCLLAFHLSMFLAVPFAWGWVAHLIADSMTPAGLDSVLWPLRTS